MHDKPYLLSLLDYNIWARDLYYAQVDGLPDGELTRQRPSVMNSFLVLLNHFLVVEKVWMAHMKGRPHGFDKLQTVLHEDVASLQAAQHDMDREIRGYIEGLSDEELEEEVSYELIGGNTGRLPRYMILTHLIMHGAFHRGYIADMMGQVPARPAPQDIPVWERAAREQ